MRSIHKLLVVPLFFVNVGSVLGKNITCNERSIGRPLCMTLEMLDREASRSTSGEAFYTKYNSLLRLGHVVMTYLEKIQAGSHFVRQDVLAKAKNVTDAVCSITITDTLSTQQYRKAVGTRIWLSELMTWMQIYENSETVEPFYCKWEEIIDTDYLYEYLKPYDKAT